MITVKPFREEALKAGFLSLQDRISIEYEDFKNQLKDWDVKAFHDGVKTVGMLMVKDNELHVAVLPEVRGKWLSRRLINEVFKPILEKHPQAKTKVSPENLKGLDFVYRLRKGFVELTFDPTTALVGIGGSLLSGAIQGGAAESAAQTQAGAANQATQTQQGIFNTQNAQQQPYRDAGYTALGQLTAGLGAPGGANQASKQWAMDNYLPLIRQNMAGIGQPIDPGWKPDDTTLTQWAQQAPDSVKNTQGGVPQGYFAHQFNAQDLNSNLAPNYAFQLSQGLGATQNQLNQAGGSLSGNALQGINTFAQNFAGNAYQNAFNNYTTNQNNIFGRLSQVAGLGSTANQQSAGVATGLAPGISSSIQSAGASQAAGTVGAANALTGGANNALGWYSLGNMLNPGSSSVGNSFASSIYPGAQ